MTSKELLAELRADAEKLRENDLFNVHSLVRYMLEVYELGNKRDQLAIKMVDEVQKDHDEYIEEMSLGGEIYKVPR